MTLALWSTPDSPSVNMSRITDVVRKAYMKINFMLRCFAVKNPEPYIKMDRSIVLHAVLHASAVWYPPHKANIEKLNKLQNYFRRRVHWRCGLECDSLPMSDIEDSHWENDVDMIFEKIISDTLSLEKFFKTRPNDRRGTVYEPLLTPKKNQLSHSLPRESCGAFTEKTQCCRC